MPVPVQNARVSAAVHREFNIVGRYRAQIDEIIVPVAVVADLSTQSLPLTRKASAFFSVAAVALEFPTLRLETPNGVLARIVGVTAWNLAGGDQKLNVHFGSTIVAPTTISPKSFMDGRLRAAGETPAGVLATGTQVAPLTPIHAILAMPQPARGQVGVIMDWPMGADNAFDFVEFQGNTLNAGVEGYVEWIEYLPSA